MLKTYLQFSWFSVASGVMGKVNSWILIFFKRFRGQGVQRERIKYFQFIIIESRGNSARRGSKNHPRYVDHIPEKSPSTWVSEKRKNSLLWGPLIRSFSKWMGKETGEITVLYCHRFLTCKAPSSLFRQGGPISHCLVSNGALLKITTTW